MIGQKELREEIENFKIKIENVNESFFELESQFESERYAISDLKESFIMIIKLIDHELLESIGGTENLLNLFKPLNE